MTTRHSGSHSVLIAAVGAALCFASACGQSTDGVAGSGGNGSGGRAESGGSSGAGGMVASGGSSATGGTVATGGATSRGGAGGTSATGGAIASGGATSNGGAGGTSARDGSAGRADADDAAANDGARSDGSAGTDVRGDSASGGAMASGGTTASGGALGSGGAGGSRADGGVDPTKTIKVWLAGDSTVMNCSSACPCGWGSQFQALLVSNATVVNSAVGGRSIQTWLYESNVTSTKDSAGECTVSPKTYATRWQDMTNPTSGMQPGDYLLIEFGINDGDSSCPRHVGTALFQSYLGTMAKAAKDLGAQPVFLTSTSYIGCSGSTATTNRGFVAETKAAGTANNVPVIDLTALSAQLYTSLGLCPNDSNYTSTTSAVGQFFCEDHTHFEAAGAAKIAGVVAKALREQGIGLAAYLK